MVTGAGRGLGRGYSLALAQAGAHVVCVDVNADDLEQTVAEVQDAGGEASSRTLSVTDVAGFRRFTQDVAADHGHLDILVNNAGTEIPKDAADVTEADFDTIIGVNLRGTYFCAQSAAAVMVKQGSGKIINIGSWAARSALPAPPCTAAPRGSAAVHPGPGHRAGKVRGPGERDRPGVLPHADDGAVLPGSQFTMPGSRSASRSGGSARLRTLPAPSCSSRAPPRTTSRGRSSTSTAAGWRADLVGQGKHAEDRGH